MTSRAAGVLAAVWALVGCGGDSAMPDAAVDARAPLDSPTDAGRDAALGPGDCDATWIERIEGRIVDEAGDPIAAARPQACLHVAPSGVLVCLAPPMSAADGSYLIEPSGDERCVESLALRVLLPSSPYATTYCHLDASAASDGVLALAEPVVLYATAAATVLPPLGDDTVSRTVGFEDGLEIDVVPAELGFGLEYATLRGRRVPVAPDVPCFAREVASLAGLYAFGDEGAVDDGDFPLRIPNSTGLPAGAAVELFVLGGLDTFLADGTPVREADFVPFGTGAVSADGTHVASDPGSGLPHFTWLGYRPSP